MWDVGIAKMLKERDNRGRIGPCVGKVISVSPLQVTILNENTTLQGNIMYIADNLTNLKITDEVLVIPSESEQVFFITNKVNKVGV